MKLKPTLPKGTRDFSPEEMLRRNYIFNIIKKHFKRYGFQQIETPAIENLNTLIGTGGDESDKLIFKILNSGDYLAKADEKALKEKNSNALTKSISEKALHYDLTVPFARYVVQHQNDITFPFKRYQIQPVWRADKPQKGRYREFYQCDADIIGSNSLLNEVDLIKLIDDVFSELFQGKLNYTISINNRKILGGIAQKFNISDRIDEMMIIIDKLDKIGVEGVKIELQKSNLPIQILEAISLSDLTNNDKINRFKQLINNESIGEKGLEELSFILNALQTIGLKTAKVNFDPTLARGLGYYTGTIIEVKVKNFPSITGGGRYDNLTGNFGLDGVSGVGISFGADRIYDVLLDYQLYPEFLNESTQVLFLNFGEAEQNYCLPLVYKLRNQNINTELYPDSVKIKKQMKYANDKKIKYVVMIGQNEMETQSLTYKNMETGEQFTSTFEQFLKQIEING
ncbi:MAG: histidine--tRNA ligase [Vicingaceae bacterium]